MSKLSINIWKQITNGHQLLSNREVCERKKSTNYGTPYGEDIVDEQRTDRSLKIKQRKMTGHHEHRIADEMLNMW